MSLDETFDKELLKRNNPLSIIKDCVMYVLTEEGDSYYVNFIYPDKENIIIQNNIDGIPVVSLGEKCSTKNEKIESVVIPSTVITIEKNAFKMCVSLREVILQEGIKEISDNVFFGCKNLKDVTLPQSLEKIGQSCFTYSGIVAIDIPHRITRIEPGLFNKCNSLKDVILPQGLLNIGSRSFYKCPLLKTIFVPKTVRSIQRSSFNGGTNVCMEHDESVKKEVMKLNGMEGRPDVIMHWNCSYRKELLDSVFSSECDNLDDIL